MPYAPRRPCLHPGCPALVQGKKSRCPRHQSEYDLRRGSAAERGPYNSALHKQWRRAVILRDRCCVDCGRPLLDRRGEPLPRAHSDHIIPLTAGGDYTLDNGAARCHRDHSRKTMRELHRRGLSNN